jgi:hypothetical protein
MTPGPAAVATVQVVWQTEDGIMIAYGTTFPVDTTAGYAPGCLFIDTANAQVLINEGTAASCDFDAITTA